MQRLLMLSALILGTSTLVALGACDDGGDGDGDTDTDVDADSDSDTDADGDTDADADTDVDGDVDGDTDTDTDVDGDADGDGGADGGADADGAVDGGGAFAFTFSGTGFSPHDGQALSAALVDDGTDAVVVTDSTTVEGGTFGFDFGDVLEEGTSYRVDYYADFNGNGSCDAPPGDHVWRAVIGEATADVDLTVTHTTDFEPAACDSFGG